MIDWTLVARYAGPILALLVGAALGHFFEKRPRLLSYLAHTSAVTVRPPNGQPTRVHTHSIVVKNAGKKPATNVRVGHHVLPDFNVYPSVEYQLVELPGGGKDILFPTLVPGEQVTVTYLYFPPLIWSNINSHTKSDEGFAKIVNVLPTPQWSPWLARAAWLLMIVGFITLVTAVGQFLVFLVRHWWGG